MLKRWVLSLRLKTLTESQARMSNGRSFQFVAAECLKQRDDETVRMLHRIRQHNFIMCRSLYLHLEYFHLDADFRTLFLLCCVGDSASIMCRINSCYSIVICFLVYTVTSGPQNLEISWLLTAVREMSGILLKVREVSGRKSCQGKMAKNCLLLVAYLCLYG